MSKASVQPSCVPTHHDRVQIQKYISARSAESNRSKSLESSNRSYAVL